MDEFPSSTGILGSSTSIIDGFRHVFLRNSAKTLTSEAEALLQHTYGKEWSQPHDSIFVSTAIATVPQSTIIHSSANVNIPNQYHHDNAYNSLLSPVKSFMQPNDDDIIEHPDFDLIVGDNTLDWVSNLYNNIPPNELNSDDLFNSGDDFNTDVDFLNFGRVSLHDNQNQEADENDDNILNDLNKNNKSSNSWPMACAECGYIAGNRKQLWRHGKRENHTTRSLTKPPTFVPKTRKEKPDHKCDSCEYTSKSRFNVLRHHQRVHVNQKMTMCALCSKQFKDLDTLKTHIRYTHENERRHSCELCEKQFVSSSDLQRHKRIVHDKVRDFVCQKCNKRFQTSTNAKRHFYEVCGKDKNTCQMDVITTINWPHYVQF